MNALASQAPASQSVGSHAVARCTHCSQPLASAAVDGFCCAGCRSVHALLESSGLSRYYALRGDTPLAPAQLSALKRDRQWLEAMLASTPVTGLRRFALDLQGIQCTACVWLVDALFRRMDDAYQISLNPALGRVSLAVGPNFDLAAFVETVERFGYLLGPAKKEGTRKDRGLLIRMGICLALAGNTMFLSATTYFGLERGPIFDLVQHATFVMATLSLVIGGSHFFDRAWAGLKRGILHLDLPIALGMLLAYAGSTWSVFFGGARATYLDTVSVFIALMLVGRVLQERLVERNRRQLLSADGASGMTARRVRDARTELVACRELTEGDELLVCPGEIVPVAARLESDIATCSLDWINGESTPQVMSRGQEVLAGAVNVGEEAFRLRALRGFERSDLDLLLRSDDAGKQRVRGDFWDAVARGYVLLVLIATAGAIPFALWRGASPLQVLEIATAVLVITCPCAFGIATPLAYELAVSGLRKSGLFVRDATFFDRAAQVKRIVFDKTGTLTTGALVVRDLSALSSLSRDTLAVLYDLAARSNHPKSLAVARAVEALDPEVRLSDASVREVAGKGLETTRDGVLFRFGAPTWAADGTESGPGPVLSANGVVLAVLDTKEVPRPDARQEALALERDGYELWIASGDERAHVEAVAQELAIHPARARANMSPEDKRLLIDALDRRDTLMVGDGINDGLALSRAHCSGTPAVDRPFVPARADFYFLTPGLLPLRTALNASRLVRRVVHNALGFALLYNVFAIAISYAGLMRPWLAAVLMPASSLLVLTYTAISLSPRRRLWRS
jgi:Cu2+-exporting ATPase